jgi:hypothetical protein
MQLEAYHSAMLCRRVKQQLWLLQAEAAKRSPSQAQPSLRLSGADSAVVAPYPSPEPPFGRSSRLSSTGVPSPHLCTLARPLLLLFLSLLLILLLILLLFLVLVLILLLILLLILILILTLLLLLHLLAKRESQMVACCGPVHDGTSPSKRKLHAYRESGVSSGSNERLEDGSAWRSCGASPPE